MVKLNYKKAVGTALSMLFGVFVLIGIFNILSPKLGFYDSKIMPFFWMALNLVTVASMAIIAFNRNNRFTIIAKIGAFALIILYISYFINHIVTFTTDNTNNIFTFLGNNVSVILDTLTYGAIALLLFGLEIWNPIKYIGILGYIPSLIASFTIAKLNDIPTTDNFEQYESLISRLDVLSYISWGINIITLVLIIVWLVKKPIVPSAQSKTIDII